MFPTTVELTFVVLTGKSTDVEFAATVAEFGTIAAGLALERLMTAPPEGAKLLKLTVPVAPCPPITADGFTLTELKVGAVTVGLCQAG